MHQAFVHLRTALKLPVRKLPIARRQAAFATIVAVAAAAVGTTAAMTTGTNRPPAPPRLNAWQVPGTGDGLNRFVVQLAAYHPAPAAAPLPSGGQAADQLDVTALLAAQARYGTDGVLERGSEGSPVYVVKGQSIPVGVAAAQPAPAATNPPVGNPLAALAATPGIASAQRLPDGSVLVATKLTAAQVAAVPVVTKVSVSSPVHFDSTEAPTPNDPFFSYEWFMKNTGWVNQGTATAGDDIGALRAWPLTTGNGTVIADLDSGTANVPDLAGTLWTNPHEPCGTTDTDGDGYAGDCHGWNFYRNSADVSNGGDNVHGTGVAGAMAAVANNGVGVAGEAPGVKVMPLVIGSGQVADMNLAIAAIYYAVDHGATVINCSFGGTADPITVARLKAAIDYAGTHGVLVVAAAGNSSTDIDKSPVYPASLVDAYLLTVGATDANDDLAGFSNYGSTTVDLFAPGVNIATTGNDGSYVQFSGTSLSAPLVAAAIAMEKSSDPTATVDQLRSRLLAALTPAPSLTGKGVHAGVLNVGNAIAGVHYHFTGLGTIASGAVSSPTLTVSGAAPAGPYTLKLRLATHYQGATYAVSGVPVTITGTTYTTDDSGSIQVPVSGSPTAGITVTPSVTLPDGNYAWVTQLAANGVLVGRPAAAMFDVGFPVLSPPLAVSSPPATASGPASGDTSPTTGTGGDTSGGGTTGSGTSAGATPPVIPSDTATPGGSGVTSTPGPTSTSGSGSTGGTSPSSPGNPGSTPGGTPSVPAQAGGPSAPGSGGGGGNAPPGSTASPTPAPTGTTTFAPAPDATPTTSSAPAISPSGSSAPVTSPSPGPPPSSGGSSGGSQTFPGTDPFGIVGLAPSTVSTSGGDMVTILGTNLPLAVSVLVGGQRADVLPGNTAQQLTFFTPAAVAGTYDVQVFDTTTQASTTLHDALTYVVTAGGSSAQPTANATPPDGSTGDGSTGTAGSSTGDGTSTDGGTSSSPPATGDSPAPSGSPTIDPSTGASTSPSPSPSAGTEWTPVIVTGPDGLRLVGGDPSLAGLDSLWANGVCASSGCDATPF